MERHYELLQKQDTSTVGGESFKNGETEGEGRAAGKGSSKII